MCEVLKILRLCIALFKVGLGVKPQEIRRHAVSEIMLPVSSSQHIGSTYPSIPCSYIEAI